MNHESVGKRKRGRPRKDGAKNDVYAFRLDKDDAYKFEMICFEEERNRGELMREALHLLFESRKYRKK